MKLGRPTINLSTVLQASSAARGYGLPSLKNPLLIHGECLAALAKIPSKSVDLILCDLPYGTTANKWDSIIPMDKLWMAYNRVAKDTAPVVLFAQLPFDKVLSLSNLKNLKYEWIWVKESGTGFLNAKIAPMKAHENILVFCRTKTPYYPQMRTGYTTYTTNRKANASTCYGRTGSSVTTNTDGTRYPLDVLYYKRDNDRIHPTQKPIQLLEYLIRTYTEKGAIVLDNTMGSGSTGVAAVNTGRRFIGMELDKDYYDTACRRIRKAGQGLFK